MEKYAKIKAVLNQAVADLSELSALIHQIHWYIRGQGFLALHEKMDELRETVEAQLDQMAEQLIVLGGAPYSTLGEFEEYSKLSLTPTSYDISTTERLQELVEAFRHMVNLYQGGICLAANEEEEVTMNIMADGLAYFQKQIWMLSAEIGLAPL